MQNHPNKQNITFSHNPVKYTKSHQVQHTAKVPICGQESCDLGILYTLSQGIIITIYQVGKYLCLKNLSTQSNSLRNRIF